MKSPWHPSTVAGLQRRAAVVAIPFLASVRSGIAAGAEPAPVPAELLVRRHSPVLGSPSAAVTLVEFLDPACEACRAQHGPLQALLARRAQRLRLVIRFAAFHRGSDVAIGMLVMARLQGRFEPVLDAFFEQQALWASHGSPDLRQAWRIAADAGLDVSEAKQREALPEVGVTLRGDRIDADALGIERTPTFFLDGRPLPLMAPGDVVALVEARVAQPGGPSR